jgi:hypothetical protein
MVIHAMVLLQRAGAAKLGFLTDPEKIKNPVPRADDGAAAGAQ